MQRLLKIAALLFLATPLFVSAQIVVTGTVVDPNGNPYANGTTSAQSVAASGQATYYTSPATTSSTGLFSLTLPRTATWVFSICAPPVQLGPTVNPTPKQVCFSSQPISISGSGDISAQVIANVTVPILGPVLSGNGNSTNAIVTNPSSSSQNTITPQNPDASALTINTPAGDAPGYGAFQVNNDQGYQILGVQAPASVYAGVTASGQSPFNVGGGLSPAWVMQSDPYCAGYETAPDQGQWCNHNGQPVWQNSPTGQNMVPVLIPDQDLYGTGSQAAQAGMFPVFAGGAIGAQGTPGGAQYLARFLASPDIPNNAANTTGSSAALSVSGQTGLFSVTGLASTNRTMTVPDAAFSAARIDAGQTFTGTQVFSSKITASINGNADGTAGSLAGGAVGSFPYQSASGATSMLAGNTTTGPMVLVSVGSGSAALPPVLMKVIAASAAAVNVGFSALTDGTTVTWNAASNAFDNKTLLFTTHGGSRTLNVSNLISGGHYVLTIQQDATGGEGLTLGSGCTWKVSGGGGGAISLSAGANAIDLLDFRYDGTNCYAILTKNFT